MQMEKLSLFSKYSIDVSAAYNKENEPPLLHHTQIRPCSDVLSRKNNHHLLLKNTESVYFKSAFITALLFHLQNQTAFSMLQDPLIIYFDTQRFYLSNENSNDIERDFLVLQNEIKLTHKTCILILNDSNLLESEDQCIHLHTFSKLLKTKLADPQWRLIVFCNDHRSVNSAMLSFFNLVTLNSPATHDVLAIIKTYKSELEDFHQISIPTEIYSYSLSLASHYLTGTSLLDKTIKLLDSGAALASKEESPVLTMQIIASIVSNWTSIPSAYLHHNKFKLSQFTQTIQESVFGQDYAIKTIGELLQTCCINMKNESGPICSLLLTGPAGVGKTKFVYALSEYLFSNLESVFCIAESQKKAKNLEDIVVTVRSNNAYSLTLHEAVQSKPYGIVLFEHLDEESLQLLNLFNDVFLYGYTFDKQGKIYDFRNTIIIVNTTLAGEKITSLTQNFVQNDSSKITDLMQLVLNETTQLDNSFSHLSPQELHDQVLPHFNKIPVKILNRLHIIPFMPLSHDAMNKVIKIKLHTFNQFLESEFGINLAYASEVIKFLTNEMIKKDENALSIFKLFDQHVYSSVANKILGNLNQQQKIKRLSLSLNATGHLLQCESLVTEDTINYMV